MSTVITDKETSFGIAAPYPMPRSPYPTTPPASVRCNMSEICRNRTLRYVVGNTYNKTEGGLAPCSWTCSEMNKYCDSMELAHYLQYDLRRYVAVDKQNSNVEQYLVRSIGFVLVVLLCFTLASRKLDGAVFYYLRAIAIAHLFCAIFELWLAFELSNRTMICALGIDTCANVVIPTTLAKVLQAVDQIRMQAYIAALKMNACCMTFFMNLDRFLAYLRPLTYDRMDTKKWFVLSLIVSVFVSCFELAQVSEVDPNMENLEFTSSSSDFFSRRTSVNDTREKLAAAGLGLTPGDFPKGLSVNDTLEKLAAVGWSEFASVIFSNWMSVNDTLEAVGLAGLTSGGSKGVTMPDRSIVLASASPLLDGVSVAPQFSSGSGNAAGPQTLSPIKKIVLVPSAFTQPRGAYKKNIYIVILVIKGAIVLLCTGFTIGILRTLRQRNMKIRNMLTPVSYVEETKQMNYLVKLQMIDTVLMVLDISSSTYIFMSALGSYYDQYMQLTMFGTSDNCPIAKVQAVAFMYQLCYVLSFLGAAYQKLVRGELFIIYLLFFKRFRAAFFDNARFVFLEIPKKVCRKIRPSS